MAANYSALLTEVADWIKRSDQTDRIPSYIQMAESQMNALLRLRIMEATATLTLSAAADNAALPTGFMEPIALAYTTGDGPRLIDVESMQAEIDSAASSGRPRYYCYGPTTVYFERAADQEYTLTSRYYKKLDLASDSTNAVNTAAPFAYLYGALAAFCSWDENDAGAARYDRLFKEQIGQLVAADNNSRGRATIGVDPMLVSARRFDINTGAY